MGTDDNNGDKHEQVWTERLPWSEMGDGIDSRATHPSMQRKTDAGLKAGLAVARQHVSEAERFTHEQATAAVVDLDEHRSECREAVAAYERALELRREYSVAGVIERRAQSRT